ncbi:MAG: hypothetical protein P9X26_07565 [Candidatus Stygibacter frigidus]|nr:hypothetical protein [Candidatus Stygibacter frigidus]
MKNIEKLNTTFIRQKLHANAELSGKESNTAELIRKWLGKLGCSDIIENIGGNSLVAVFNSESSSEDRSIKDSMLNTYS